MPHNSIHLLIPFLTAQSAAFLSKKQYRHNTKTNSQSVSYAEVTASAKVFENISETEHVNAQPTDFQKTLDLIEQIEELIEPYRVKNC